MGRLESKGVENLEIIVDVKAKKLNMVVDLSKKGKVSASGKSITVSSSRGKYKIPGTKLFLMFNLFAENKKS